MTKILFGMLVALATSTTVAAAPPDTLKQFDISAEAHAFMCPFLTPRYIEFISSNSDCKVVKTDDLVLHVYCFREDDLSEEELLKLADRVGYEPKNITIKRVR